MKISSRLGYPTKSSLLLIASTKIIGVIPTYINGNDMNLFSPASPGEILSEYLDGLTVTEAAKKLAVTRVNLSNILHGHTGISPEMSLKLSKAFGTSALYWLNLNNQYELWKLDQRKDEILEAVKVFN